MPDLVKRLIACVAERDLLSYASAIAFQVTFALLPAALAILATLGFLGLESVWTDEVRPTVQDRLPQDAFAVVERTVEQILSERRGLWLTFGIVFTLWQLSGAIRATTGPLNLIYGAEEDRSWLNRMTSSILLAVAIAPCLLLAVLGITLGNDLLGELDPPGAAMALGWVVRWVLAIALMLAAIWLLLRVAPAVSAGWQWVGLGSAVVIGGWVVATIVYGWYVTTIASYGSLFGGLATIIVLLTYIYILALVFLIGVQLDALVRERVQDDRGDEDAG